MKDIKVLGVKVSPITFPDTIQKIDELCSGKKPALICTANTEFLIKAQNDDEFREILNRKSKLNLPDGGGLLWASKFLSLPAKNSFQVFGQWLGTICLIPLWPKYFKTLLPERVAGSDLVVGISEMAAKKNYRLFLLGGASTVAERAALKLQTDIYNLKITGVSSDSPDKTDQIVEMVKKSKAEILLVAYGAPKQEKWLAANLSSTGAKVGIGIGGSFDFLAGTQKRAPKWMQKRNLEWLFRLVSSPSRIKRQFALPKFMWLVLKEKLKAAK